MWQQFFRNKIGVISGAVLPVVLSLLILCGCAGTVSQTSEEKTVAKVPIITSPTGQIRQGSVIWHDLLVPDPGLVSRFYQQLFGWKMEQYGDFILASLDGRPVAGILKVEKGEFRPQAVWVPTFSVMDVDQAAALAVRQGGEVLKGPVDMEERGRAALVEDPQGAQLVLLKPINGDPQESGLGNGEWLWNEVWTSDAGTTLAFYSALFRYDDTLAMGDEYIVLVSEDRWRTGIRQVNTGGGSSRWLPVIQVNDPLATARHAESLGGAVLIAPQQSLNNGNVALLSDTAGALLIVQRWPIQDTSEEN